MIPSSQAPVYLDYAATTPLDPRVLDAMMPYFTNLYGNPSSIHYFGQQAEAAVERAREKVAAVLNCQPGEIIFTSCGSESDNQALRGIAFSERANRQANHLLISPVEHHAVSRTAMQLKNLHGFELEYLPVDHFGRVSPDEVSKRLRAETALVSVVYANNEIGTINPIDEIGAICQSQDIPFHTDAVQAATYLSLDVQALQVDLLSLGAHKFYGPKGVGVLYNRKSARFRLMPVQTGGGQEFGLRAGTQNVAYIVGLAEALQLVAENQQVWIDRIQPMRDALIGRVLETIPDSRLTGHPRKRLPNHASFAFYGIDGNALITILDVEGFACSSGSACKTGNPEPSDVLTAIGLDRSWALGSLRITLGAHTTPDQIDRLVAILPEAIERARLR